jgi:hypothetical protein
MSRTGNYTGVVETKIKNTLKGFFQFAYGLLWLLTLLCVAGVFIGLIVALFNGTFEYRQLMLFIGLIVFCYAFKIIYDRFINKN